VIFLKNYRYFKSAFTVFFGAIVFLCASYFYLYANIDSQRLEADKSESSVPYEASPPDNSGVMLLSVFASWLFLGEKLSLLNIAGCITMCAGLVAVTLG
jgi:multidrug transporter EmrE-like cation transporter